MNRLGGGPSTLWLLEEQAIAAMRKHLRGGGSATDDARRPATTNGDRPARTLARTTILAGEAGGHGPSHSMHSVVSSWRVVPSRIATILKSCWVLVFKFIPACVSFVFWSHEATSTTCAAIGLRPFSPPDTRCHDGNGEETAEDTTETSVSRR